jgi:hypothetical protein
MNEPARALSGSAAPHTASAWAANCAGSGGPAGAPDRPAAHDAALITSAVRRTNRIACIEGTNDVVEEGRPAEREGARRVRDVLCP